MSGWWESVTAWWRTTAVGGLNQHRAEREAAEKKADEVELHVVVPLKDLRKNDQLQDAIADEMTRRLRRGDASGP